MSDKRVQYARVAKKTQNWSLMTRCLSAVSFADKKLWAFAETETSKYDNKCRLPRSNIGHMYFCSVFAMDFNLFIECTIGTCVYSLPYIGKIFKTRVLEKMCYNSKTAEKACACSFATSEFSLRRRACNYKYYKLTGLFSLTLPLVSFSPPGPSSMTKWCFFSQSGWKTNKIRKARKVYIVCSGEVRSPTEKYKSPP